MGTLRANGALVVVVMKEIGDLLVSHKKKVFAWAFFRRVRTSLNRAESWL